MIINIRLNDTVELIEGKILKEIRNRLNSAFHRAAIAIKARIGDVCISLIEKTPEYQSLLNGELLGELGIPDVQQRVDGILQAIVNGVDVSVVTPVIKRDQIEGGMVVGIYKQNFTDILNLSEASYVSLPSGETINWLDWLLLQGEKIIVYGYDSFFNLTPSQKARSRTGLALMFKGMGWRVPLWATGTENDNFLTRAFNFIEVETLITKIFEEEITARL